MGKDKRTYYTLVQHSAFAFKGDESFRHAVEEAPIDGDKGLRAVVRSGGLLFPEYKDARDEAYRVNYPGGTEGLIPQAPGTFDGDLDGQAIYVPPNKAERFPPMASVPQSFIGITGTMAAEPNIRLVNTVRAAGIDPADLNAVRRIWDAIKPEAGTEGEG